MLRARAKDVFHNWLQVLKLLNKILQLKPQTVNPTQTGGDLQFRSQKCTVDPSFRRSYDPQGLGPQKGGGLRVQEPLERKDLVHLEKSKTPWRPSPLGWMPSLCLCQSFTTHLLKAGQKRETLTGELDPSHLGCFHCTFLGVRF